MKRFFRLLRRHINFSLAALTLILSLILSGASLVKPADWLLAGGSILLLLPMLWAMWQRLRAGQYGVNILVAAAVVAAVSLAQWWTAISLVLILAGYDILLDYAKVLANQDLNLLLAQAPHRAVVIRKGKPAEIKAAELHAGDKIIIKAGETVPADSVITEGTANFDETSLTGQSASLPRQAGDNLLAGALNLDGQITAKVTAEPADSQYRQLIKHRRAAVSGQTVFGRLTASYNLPLTLLVYAVAAAAWALSGRAIRFLDVLAVASPAPLLLPPEIALIGGVSRAARYGIVFKTALAMERLAKAKTFVFSKTGTLTFGQPTVEQVRAFGKFNQTEVLRLAASLGQSSRHPAAAAVVEAVKTANLKPAKTKHAQETIGRGISASLQGKAVLVGRLSFITDEGIELPARYKPASLKQTAVYVAIDGQLAGVITLRDTIRPEAAAAIAGLRRLGGREIIMATGDAAPAAKAVASELAIDRIEADMLPADKIHLIEKAGPRPLAYVSHGDDVAALTAADLGITFGARQSLMLNEPADLIIMPDDLSRLTAARYLAGRTFKLARQAILAGTLLTLALMLVFASGKFPPLAGVFLQAAVIILVVALALRARQLLIND